MESLWHVIREINENVKNWSVPSQISFYEPNESFHILEKVVKIHWYGVYFKHMADTFCNFFT